MERRGFRLPFETMDLLWYAQEHNVPVPQVAQVMGLPDSEANAHGVANAVSELNARPEVRAAAHGGPAGAWQGTPGAFLPWPPAAR